ncbi:MAG: hypothetical protein ACLFUK_06430 [Halanaerobium sp.]
MNSNLTLVNKITLLGLFALLAGTGNGILFALIFALTLSLTALVIRFIYLTSESFFSQKSGKIILWAAGFAISYFLYHLLPLIFNNQSVHFNYYFILIGVTPLVYAELNNKSFSNFIINHLLFLDLMLAVSLLRELLGEGSILNYQIFINPPLSIATEAPGAFMIVGITAFIYEIIIKKLNLERKIKKEAGIELESEVKA